MLTRESRSVRGRRNLRWKQGASFSFLRGAARANLSRVRRVLKSLRPSTLLLWQEGNGLGGISSGLSECVYGSLVSPFRGRAVPGPRDALAPSRTCRDARASERHATSLSLFPFELSISSRKSQGYRDATGCRPLMRRARERERERGRVTRRRSGEEEESRFLRSRSKVIRCKSRATSRVRERERERKKPILASHRTAGHPRRCSGSRLRITMILFPCPFRFPLFPFFLSSLFPLRPSRIARNARSPRVCAAVAGGARILCERLTG